MRHASVQIRIDLQAIEDGVARFGAGAQAEYCAVIEIAGSQQSLAKVDDAKQEELLAAYAQFLNSLTFPFQLVIQVHPVDLGWYVMRIEERARSLSPALVALARDHAAFVQGLTRQRTLLERRTYIAVPWSAAAELGTDGNALVLRRLWGRRRRHTDVENERALHQETIKRELTDRCDAIARQLSRAGIRTSRLDDVSLAQLYHSSWAPEVARTQRLRRELADYTALAVGAEIRPIHGASADGNRDMTNLEQLPTRWRA